MITKEEAAFFMDAAKLNADDQRELFSRLSAVCTEAEIEALKIGVAHFRMQMFPELKKAMADAMYQAFNA